METTRSTTHRRTLVAAALLAVLVPALSRADGPRREGLWEMTMTMSMPGMPMQPPPMTYTECLDGKSWVPQDPKRRSECQILDQKIDGHTVTWRVSCAKGEGSGKLTFGEGSLDGTATFKVTLRNGQAMEATETFHGVRKGDCKK